MIVAANGLFGSEDSVMIRPVTHFVYMLRCADGSLYTGAAKDWQHRLKLHMSGRAAKYTRSRRPVQLVLLEPHTSKSAALKAEAAIKRVPKLEKERYVRAGRSR